MRLTSSMLLFCTLLCTAGSVLALQVDESVAVAFGAGADLVNVAPEQEAYQRGGPSLSQAVEQVRRQYNGKIVSAETIVRGGRETHIIKVLTQDGTVKTVRVAGRTRS